MTICLFPPYLCLTVVSQEEVLLEPVEVHQPQRRKLCALAGLEYFGGRQAGPLNGTERDCFLLKLGTRKPRQ